MFPSYFRPSLILNGKVVKNSLLFLFPEIFDIVKFNVEPFHSFDVDEMGMTLSFLSINIFSKFFFNSENKNF